MVTAPPEANLVRIPEAARRLGIGRSTAYRLIKEGKWPTALVRIGGSQLVPRAEIDRLSSPSVPATEVAA